MFLYEGNELSQSVPLKALSMKHVNFKRDEPIIALQKQPPKMPINIMKTMLELFGGLGSPVNDDEIIK